MGITGFLSVRKRRIAALALLSGICGNAFAQDIPRTCPKAYAELLRKKDPPDLRLAGTRISKRNRQIRNLVNSLGTPGKPVVHTRARRAERIYAGISPRMAWPKRESLRSRGRPFISPTT